jgi:hypothetical protein
LAREIRLLDYWGFLAPATWQEDVFGGEMSIPTKVKISLAIILGIGLGTGALIFGILMASHARDDDAGFIAGGSAVLASSVSALIAHLAGGFRDLEDREP